MQTLGKGVGIFSAVFAIALALNHSAFATSRTWSGGGDNVNWNDGANWNPNGTPASGDALSLTASIPDSMTIGTDIGATSITFANNFNATNSASVSSSPSGGNSVTLTLGSGWSISDNATSGDVLFANGGNTVLEMNLNGAGVVSVASGANLRLTNQINDGTSAGSIEKTGGGTLGIGGFTGGQGPAGANTYSGGTTVDAGTLQILVNNALPQLGTLTVNGGNTVNNNNFPTTFDLNGQNQSVGALNGNTVGGIGGWIVNNAANTTSILTVGTGDASGTFNGTILNGQGITGLTKVGTGTQILSGVNPYQGDTTISGGTLKFTGTASAIGNVSVAAGATLDASNTGAGLSIGALNGKGSVVINTFSFGLNTPSSVSATFDGVISGNGMVNKTGPGNGGTQIFTGANTYGGGTDIHNGTVLLNNTSGSGTGSGAINVFGGTLGGTGFINAGANNVAINPASQGATITGGDNGTIGTLSIRAANLVFTGGMFNLATYVVDLDNVTSDKLALTGNLDLSNAFDQISFQGTTGAASYQLLTFTGTRTGTFNTVTNLPAGYTLQYNSGEIDLVMTGITAVPEPATWAAGALACAVIGYQFLVIRRRRFARLLRA